MMNFKDFLKMGCLVEDAKRSYEDIDNYIKRLIRTRKIKIKRIGQGHFASVFQHPVYHNVVVKVFANDSAYEKYLQFCESHQGNPYVPKIISVHYFEYRGKEPGDWDDMPEINDERIGVVFMQKLRPCEPQELRKFAAKMYKIIFPGWRGSEDEDAQPFDFTGFSDEDWEILADRTRKTDPAFSQLARWLSHFEYSDTHESNVMVDEHGHLVFTDPVAD